MATLYLYMRISKGLLLLNGTALIWLFYVSNVFAQTTIVTISENPLQTTSSLSNTNVFDFNSMSRGLNTNVLWSGVGSFDQLYISGANVYGGAYDPITGSASQFSAVGSRWAQTSVLTLDESSSYFGLWWSAGDAGNRLSFYNGDNLVTQYTTSSMFGNLNLSNEYYGNPLTGQNSREPYAFINFYGDELTSWDRIELTQVGGGGFESDNYTSRVEGLGADDLGSEVGLVIAEVSGAETEIVTDSYSTWISEYVQAAPSAPTPPFYALIVFAVVIVLRDRFRRLKDSCDKF